MGDRDTHQDDALVGQILHDTYRVKRKIAEGGMGAVYAAEHARLPNKRFAIKMLLPGVAKMPQVFERFRREAVIASELGHPNIVDVLDFFTTKEGQPYLVMEYLEGDDLAAVLLKRRRLPPDLLTELLAQVGSALSAAHDHGVVHRDLKPENIFVSDLESGSPTVKVLDFGISKIRDSKSVVTQDLAIMGTPFYMSPEQAEGQVRDIDQATDIFALGIICYESLTGKLPFDAPTMPGVMYKICHIEPDPPSLVWPALPAGIDAVIARALAKKKDDRYPRVGDFVDAITTALDDIPIPEEARTDIEDKEPRRTQQGLGAEMPKGEPATSKVETMTVPSSPGESSTGGPMPEELGRTGSPPDFELRQSSEIAEVVLPDGAAEDGRETDPYSPAEQEAEVEELAAARALAEDKRKTTLSRSVGESHPVQQTPVGLKRRSGIALVAVLGVLLLGGSLTGILMLASSSDRDQPSEMPPPARSAASTPPSTATARSKDAGGPVATPIKNATPDSGKAKAEIVSKAPNTPPKVVSKQRPAARTVKKNRPVRGKRKRRKDKEWADDPFGESATGRRAPAPKTARKSVDKRRAVTPKPARKARVKKKPKKQIFTGDL